MVDRRAGVVVAGGRVRCRLFTRSLQACARSIVLRTRACTGRCRPSRASSRRTHWWPSINHCCVRSRRSRVGAASLAAMTPLQGGGMSQPMKVNGVSTGLNEIYFTSSHALLDIVGTPIVMGRDVVSRMMAAPLVAVVNQAFAEVPGGPRAAWAACANDLLHENRHDDRRRVKDAVYESLRAPAPPTLYASLQVMGRPMNLVIDARPRAEMTAALRDSIQPRVPAAPPHTHPGFASTTTSSRSACWPCSPRSLGRSRSAGRCRPVGLDVIRVATRTREIGVRLRWARCPGA